MNSRSILFLFASALIFLSELRTDLLFQPAVEWEQSSESQLEKESQEELVKLLPFVFPGVHPPSNLNNPKVFYYSVTFLSHFVDSLDLPPEGLGSPLLA